MTDILTKFAALTSKQDIERVAKDYAERFGMPHKAGKGFRLCHEDDMAKGIKAAIYESNAALIALVQEAAGEIERLRKAIKPLQKRLQAIGHDHEELMALERALNPQEAT